MSAEDDFLRELNERMAREAEASFFGLSSGASPITAAAETTQGATLTPSAFEAMLRETRQRVDPIHIFLHGTKDPETSRWSPTLEGDVLELHREMLRQLEHPFGFPNRGLAISAPRPVVDMGWATIYMSPWALRGKLLAMKAPKQNLVREAPALRFTQRW